MIAGWNKEKTTKKISSKGKTGNEPLKQAFFGVDSNEIE